MAKSNLKAQLNRFFASSAYTVFTSFSARVLKKNWKEGALIKNKVLPERCVLKSSTHSSFRSEYVDGKNPSKMFSSRTVRPMTLKPASVAQLDTLSDWRPGGHGFSHRRGRQHSFVEIDREIFSSHSLSSSDSRRAVVSFWRKNVHNTG